MPMPTTDEPNRNAEMAPSPTATAAQRAQGVQTVQTPRFPGSDEHGRNPVPPRQEYPGQYHQGDFIPPPGWAGTTNVDEPYLPPDFDKVLVMRCYPEAESFGELREMAYEHGREVLRMARESTRQQAEIAGQPDPHDLSVERAATQQPGQPNPGQPMPANPPPRPPGEQPPNQPTQPAQQPGQPPQPGQDQDRERREREDRERREREQRVGGDREREERDQREQREERERREREDRERREREQKRD
jgi:hypothetical protein